MKALLTPLGRIAALLASDPEASRVVPPTGFAARLTLFTAATMAFLAVFALALALASGRLADRWADALARTATVRISAPPGQMGTQTEAVLRILRTTPGIASARAMSDIEQRRLLEPWFSPDLPVETLPLPRLIEVTETRAGTDAEALRLRLAVEAPGAVFDDHTRWRQPLVRAAGRLRLLGWTAVLLIGASMAAMIALASNAALAANAQVIGVLRLVGARDIFIARAFVRRFTRRTLEGAAIGTLAGMGVVALLPGDGPDGFLTGLGFSGAQWIVPLLLPVLAGAIGFAATRWTAMRMLRRIT
ncbi:cell division protein FtsX [Rhodovulum sulfidophilum]|uniref:Cell division transport system permease protein n=1 Tax=Rhodovulum visakhapatnamense TaxID=364297 RepID=A0A4R8FYM0_9RHOB|nr:MULTISPECIES: cell division protein FtsX [Rhodovulum]OLS45286.1 cell division protein FtsX [Rhodovulum sulfidophilum]TDX29241.1 cell division transport system permease protein [Rhodovulum visakhapatnamense]